VNSKHKCFHISFYQTEQLEGIVNICPCNEEWSDKIEYFLCIMPSQANI